MSSDTFYLDSPLLRTFITHVHDATASQHDPAARVRALRPAFGEILRDQTWLPAEFRTPDDSGGMGGSIGNYLIYRSADRDLTLMSLVLPPGSRTPVHDHLAWGLVGVYAGEQREWVYTRTDTGADQDTADLEEVEQRRLGPGDFYDLLPPDGDIHAVETVGAVPSVSIHLLGNDIGCVVRHRYEPEHHRVAPFRSSYSNAPCTEPESASEHS